MTEVSNATETPSIIEAVPSEAFSYETVQTLCDHASEAIKNNTPERAIEILVALDKGQCQGDVQPSQKFEIVENLWRQDPVAAQKLLSIGFQTFTITVNGNLVSCQAVKGISSMTFSFEHKTTEEAKELLDQAYDLFEESALNQFEDTLRTLLSMHAQYRVSNEDIANFINRLCRENIVAAERFFPLVNEFLKVAFEDGSLVIQANSLTYTVPEECFPLRTVDTGLKFIKEEDADERMELYVKLAKMHESRASEILKLAEADLAELEATDQAVAIMQLSSLYVQSKNGEGLKVLTPKLEASMDRMIENAKTARHLSLASHYAMIALVENDKQAFEKHLSSLKQARANIDSELKEGLEEALGKLETLGKKTFPIDPMVLKEQKV